MQVVYWDGPEDEVFAIRVIGCGLMPVAYPGDVLIVDKETQEVIAVAYSVSRRDWIDTR